MNKLSILLNAIEYGSFTKAADCSNYTQSGVTRIIKEMERDWGVTLLERDRGGVCVTSTGYELLPAIQKAYNECAALKAHIDDLNQLETGLIRIGSFASAAIHWLPNIMKKYQAAYPGIDFEIMIDNYQNLVQMLMRGRIDGAFLPLSVCQGMDSIYLESDEFYVVMPEGHPLERYEKVPCQLLNDYPFFMLKSGNNTEVENYLLENHLSAQRQYTLWDDFITMAMVEKGIGISLMSSTILQRSPFHLAARELEVPLKRDLGFALRSKKTCSIAIRRFLEHLEYRHTEK